ncbi:zinc-binding dehydrogenase [Solwaraspora sp. WMMD1047]|uniref:zinc-binding dehydrogenase n=1 Tax=Solwaraspora sp. WMMD1047 TaxID=3016102 RepID=UPI002415DFB7|nr:zinc-binding dehydrogenase [Solwaraspora sp. WMMD1047]MDG4831555.1 zinc-binding dehydrogenase [Solwaraspora sp. WMMD1047]
MHAVVLHEFGPAHNLRYETFPDPVPGAGEVRIRVAAAGVHQIETAMRQGLDIGPPLPELPAVFGGEVAGVVESVGPDIDNDWLGAEVVTARSRPGGYAELSVANVSSLHRIPAGLGPEAAVTMVMTGTTTIGLLDIAEVTSDDVVLITSAAGGIGRLAVQFARQVGATVIGAAGGPAKTAAVRALGADFAVDYNLPGWAGTLRAALDGRGVTLVLDGVEGDNGRAAFGLLAEGGRYVTIGAASREEFRPDETELKERGVTFIDALALLLAGQDRAVDEVRALAAAAEGRLVPAFQTFPLSQAAQAHAALEARETTGKVILVPDDRLLP